MRFFWRLVPNIVLVVVLLLVLLLRQEIYIYNPTLISDFFHLKYYILLYTTGVCIRVFLFVNGVFGMFLIFWYSVGVGIIGAATN